ncbi:sugar ABC transporter permease [Rubrobacter taiwanensis]|jgi:multiple sugar transport system permease protein|uniref:Sugar ABC transporter permease n=1 Tax=Rubrobacter taiwanensis TaxID=185139 RepID=A0A4R1BL32_9ACTN|nr:sugar ABC transporter permease [Rubrobacter taiwanensis]TCJ18064.1 sugar ABC transporter permease [Rubrobacter taiwanensis]
MQRRPLQKGTGELRIRIRRWWQRHQRRLIPYLFITPNMIVFAAFMFIPILYAFYISFHDWSLIGTSQFIGLGNYFNMMQDDLFWQVLINTAIYTLGTVPTSMILGLGVAILLNRWIPARGILRSIFFMPVVISGVAVALVASWIFNDHYGIINNTLRQMGSDPIPWLSSPTWAMPSLIIATLWTRIGFCMVIYLAGLQSIPSSYYDAAQVDGASSWKQFRYITWPLLGPTTFFLLIINVIYSFHVFDLIYVMTGGGPGFSTTVIVQYIYQAAFQTGQMGYAAAMGVVLYFIILAFTAIQWRISRQGESIE